MITTVFSSIIIATMQFLIVLTTILIASSASSVHVCYVKPSSSSQNCPGQPCLTLDEYTKQQDKYFITGTTFQFIAGNHSLNSTVYIRNESKITLLGHNDSAVNIVSESELAIIYCKNVTNFIVQGITLVFKGNVNNNQSFFIFYESKEIILKKLVFQGKFDSSRNLIRAVIFSYSINATIESCFFEGNSGFYGGAICAWISSDITLNGNTFIANQALFAGGAVFAVNSSMLLKNNTFMQNFAVNNGGAIYLQDTESSITGTLSIFLNNSAKLGAAIFSTTSAVVITSDKTYFIGGRAESAGGAYFGTYSSLSIKTNTLQLFINNSASNNSGGAIHCQYGSLELAGNSQFMNNSVDCDQPLSSGGAMCAIGCNFTLSGTVLLDHNHATKGGAIGAMYSTIFFHGTSIDFFNNWAFLAGGGMGIANSTVTIATEQLNFENNTAGKCGGGILMEFVNVNEVKNISLIGNTAKQGGGIYCIQSSYIVLSGSFINNAATLGGAVLLIQSNASHHNITATDNLGSVFYIIESNATFGGNTEFNRNSASDGGAIAVQRSTLSFEGITVFQDNHAEDVC